MQDPKPQTFAKIVSVEWKTARWLQETFQHTRTAESLKLVSADKKQQSLLIFPVDHSDIQSFLQRFLTQSFRNSLPRSGFQQKCAFSHNLQHLEAVRSCSAVQVFNDVDASRRKRNVCFCTFLLDFAISGPYKSLTSYRMCRCVPPATLSVLGLQVLAFENWNANCHRKKLEWHGERWKRYWSAL